MTRPNPQLITTLLLTFLLSSCDPQEGTMQLENSTGEVKLKIDVSRLSPLDGWKMILAVEAFDRPPRELVTEIFVNELTSQYVKMKWDNPSAGVLTFAERDGATRRFRIVATEDLTHVYELIEDQ